MLVVKEVLTKVHLVRRGRILFLLLLITFHSYATTEQLSFRDAFDKSMQLANEQRYNESLIILNTLFSAVPTLRIHLELGRVHFLTGNYAESLQIFTKILEDKSLPYPVRQTVLVYLDTINETKGRWDFNIGLTATKNPKLQPKTGIYNIFGIPLEYQNTDEETYFGFTNNLSFSRILNDSTSFNLGLQYTSYFNRISEDTVVYSDLLIQNVLHQKLSYIPFVQARQTESDESILFGNVIRYEIPYSQSILLPELEVSSTDVSEGSGSDGLKSGIGLRFFSFPEQDFSSETTLKIERYAMEKILEDRNTLRISHRRKLTPISSALEGTVSISLAEYDEIDGFWGKERKDEVGQINLEYCFQRKVFSRNPCLGYTFLHRESSIKFYSAKQDSVFIQLR